MNTDRAERNDDPAVIRIASLRLAVGMLGERENAGWWNSGFLSPASTAFLAPVFGANVFQARYQGVLHAAKRVHDERIGVGQVFHLFRLPENLEQRLFEVVQSSNPSLAAAVSSPDSAMETLQSFVKKAVMVRPGPALLALSETLESAEWVGEAAPLYSAAFSARVQCFPYISSAK